MKNQIHQNGIAALGLARQKLDNVGWVQNAYITERGCCLSYAISTSTTARYGPWAARQAIRKVIGTEYIHDWNDQTGRTYEEIKRVIDQAINVLKSGGILT